jgi:methionyl aminopeptidase
MFDFFNSNVWRTTSEEKRYEERILNEDPEQTYQNVRKAAEVHRLVRRHARRYIRPGMSLIDIAENIEDGTRALVEEHGLDAGIAFPTGLNLNHCAAHYSPNAGDTTSKHQSDHFCNRCLTKLSIIERRRLESGLWSSCQRSNSRLSFYTYMGAYL